MWGCTVAEAQRRCSGREFSEWKAYYQLERFPHERIEHQLAQLSMLFCNANRNPKRKGADFKLSDFIINYDRRAKFKTPEQIEAVMNQWLLQRNRKRGT